MLLALADRDDLHMTCTMTEPMHDGGHTEATDAYEHASTRRRERMYEWMTCEDGG